MKYWTITRTANTREIGIFPQVSLAKSYNPQLPNSHRKVIPHQFPDFVPEYMLELNKKGIASDFLDRGPLSFGMVINDQFKEILEWHLLPPHRYYPVKVFSKEQILEYFWFHCIAGMENFIDYERSTITQINKFNFKIVKNDIPIISLDWLKKFEEQLAFDHTVRLNSLFLKSDAPTFDVFDISVVHRYQLISNNLKETLSKEGITGFELKEFDLLKFDISEKSPRP